MVRKTFGRSGEAIVIDEPENRPVIQLINGQLVNHDNIAIDDSGTDSGAELAFESVDGTAIASESTEPGTDTSTDSGYTDPATATQPRTKRKWTRRNNTTDGSTSDRKKVSKFLTSNLTNLIESLHVMGAALLNEPDLIIDKDEAQLLNDAVVKLATEYGFGAMISPKTQATIDMCIAVGTVYGPRAMKIAKKHGRKQRPVAVMPNANSVQ